MRILNGNDDLVVGSPGRKPPLARFTLRGPPCPVLRCPLRDSGESATVALLRGPRVLSRLTIDLTGCSSSETANAGDAEVTETSSRIQSPHTSIARWGGRGSRLSDGPLWSTATPRALFAWRDPLSIHVNIAPNGRRRHRSALVNRRHKRIGKRRSLANLAPLAGACWFGARDSARGRQGGGRGGWSAVACSMSLTR